MSGIMKRGLAVPAMLLFASTAAAVYPPAAKDDGKFFKPETLEKAAKKVREIYREYYKDVVVETYPAVPADLEKKFKEEGKSRFFSEWADRRVDELGVNGVYILIAKDPPHLQITENKRTRSRQFTPADRRKLLSKMLGLFKEKKYDEGLLEGLDFVQSTLKTNTSTSR